jgi:hypothetical protein
MTIATRPDWNGNTPVHTFDDLQTALEYMKSNPCYEILPENMPVRPFGDIDFKVDDHVTEEEFHRLDFEVFNTIAEFFRANDKNVTQFSASSWEYRKISHRWVVPDHYVKSIAHAKAFATDLYSRIQMPTGAVGDLSVYSKLRKMRTLWTSKPNENRPFHMLQGEEEDHVISYVPQWATLIDFELEEQNNDPKPVCSAYETSYLTKLCDCVSVATWTDYTACQSLIFTLLSLGAPADLIHFYCSKATNYSSKWVSDYIRRYNPGKNRHSIGTLKFFARRDSPTQYTALGRDAVYSAELGRQMFAEMTRLTEDENTYQNWCDEKGFLKPLPLAPTVAVKSHLGTGKTRRCIEACNPPPEVEVIETKHEVVIPGDASQSTLTGGVVEARKEVKTTTKTITRSAAEKIVVISCRQTFTTHITAELKGFVDYRTIKGTEIKEDKLVVQLQSLWKCAGMGPRDLVLLDEVESILANLTPNQTHKHYVETYAAFEKMIREAKRVIVLDAFLTDRTMEMLRTLRGDAVLVINPTIPYKRTATLVSEKGLSDAIHGKMRDGKRLIAVWGAKSKAKSFHSCLSDSVKHVLYTGDSDAKIKEQHLADVDKYWAEHQLVGYTATITVGVNYNGPSFDEACVYATAWSCPSRDYIQALHRARKLKGEHMNVYINPSPRPCALEPGLEEQEAQFAQQTERVKKFLTDIKQNVLDYTTLPPWLHRVLMWNYNETITNYKHFPECIRGYFALSGIACGSELPEIASPEKAPKSARISVEDVNPIDYETAQMYSRNRQMLTDTQRYELEKYYMVQKVTKVDEFIWTAWLDARKQVDRTWSVMNLSPNQLIRDKVIDLVPRDAERLKVFQDLGFDWDTAWSQEVDRIPKVDLALFGQRVRSEKDTDEQYCRDLSKALKQWCGVETKVERKQVRKDGDRVYTYTLTHDPQGQLFSYVARRHTAADVFAED